MNTKSVKEKIENTESVTEIVEWLNQNGINMVRQSPDFISQEADLTYILDDGGEIHLLVLLNEEYTNLLEKVIDGDLTYEERSSSEKKLKELQREIKFESRNPESHYEKIVSIELYH